MTRQSVATLIGFFVLAALPGLFMPAMSADSEAASQATSESASESSSQAGNESGTPAIVKPSGTVHFSPSGVYVTPPKPVVKTYKPAPKSHAKRSHKPKHWLTWHRK